MTRLLTVAPTPIDFAVSAGAEVRDPAGYARFWKRVERESDISGIRFDHAVELRESPRYGSLRADALQRTLHVLSGEFTPDELPFEVPNNLTSLWGCVRKIRFWLYDHSVVVVELDGQVSDWLGDAATDSGERLDDLQAEAISLSGLVVSAVAALKLQPVLNVARRLDPTSAFVDWQAEEWADVSPRWVSRSLVLDFDDPDSERIARHWLADIGDETAVDELVAGGSAHVSRWLNYVHRGYRAGVATALLPDASEAWRAMRYAQYFYAALDLVDDRLNGVLAETTEGLKAWEQTDLTERLRGLSHRAELVMLDLQDLRKYVTRCVRAEMDRILDVWSYADLVEEPVRFKITICDRRLEELAAGRQARAGTVTDVILLGIGVTSVLGTALAVTDFGRSVATDPDQAGYGSASSGLTEWFASQPADAILVGSVVVSALLVVLFLAVRRSGSS